MSEEFDRALDDCIERINRGESMEACLSAHPQEALELEPLLRAMTETASAYAFTPSPDAKREARLKFQEALRSKERKTSWAASLFGRRSALAGLTAAVVVLIAGLLLFRTVLSPESLPPIAVAGPNESGNFAFLVSDAPNALDEFSQLNISVSKVGLLSESGRWVEFTPQVGEFDLTLLPGAITQELWRGDIPEGSYKGASIYVSSVRGTLKTNGELIELKLPGNKVHLELPFDIGTDSTTSFTYDLTVIRTGKAEQASRYQLRPQADQSGASKSPGRGRPGRTPQQGPGQIPAQTPSRSPSPFAPGKNKGKPARHTGT